MEKSWTPVAQVTSQSKTYVSHVHGEPTRSQILHRPAEEVHKCLSYAHTGGGIARQILSYTICVLLNALLLQVIEIQ